jgi:hypothetical protein
MKKLLKKLDWYFDYYIVWMFYKENKTDQYIEYMEKKWENDATKRND